LSGSEFVQAPFSQFDAIDTNGDGEITFEELQTFVRRYQP
jgi:EF hand domain-containing protein